MRISDWSSDVCSSDLGLEVGTRTVLDVLINQQNLFNARQAYAIAKYNYLQNRLLLDQSAGSLDIDDVQDVNRLPTVDATAQLSEESAKHTEPPQVQYPTAPHSQSSEQRRVGTDCVRTSKFC